jgi:hypothetical protein
LIFECSVLGLEILLQSGSQGWLPDCFSNADLAGAALRRPSKPPPSGLPMPRAGRCLLCRLGSVRRGIFERICFFKNNFLIKTPESQSFMNGLAAKTANC